MKKAFGAIISVLSLSITFFFTEPITFNPQINNNLICSREIDSTQLRILYEAMDGQNWQDTSWSTVNKIDQWTGITLNTEGCVRNIDLFGISSNITNFQGTLANLELEALVTLSLKQNQLQGAIPNFNSLLNLRVLELTSNKLSGIIPDFSNMPLVEQINLDNNQLTGNIPNFSNIPLLEEIVLNDNLLETIPNFVNLPNLKQLILINNKIISIPDLNKTPLLSEIRLASNQLSEIPDFSQLPELSILNLTHNQLIKIPNFNNIPNLSQLMLSNNQLTVIPNFVNFPNLWKLHIDNNQLTDVPAFSQLSELFELKLDSNRLTFEDILPFIELDIDFTYAGQDSIFKDTIITATAGEPLVIDLGIDEGVSNNVYKWYKEGVLFQTIEGNNTLTFDSFQATGTGIYQVEVRNDLAPDLVLESFPIRLEVQEMVCRERDSLALVELWNGTQENGPWTNEWDLNMPIDTWYGVTLNQEGCIICLDLDGGNNSCASEFAGGNNLFGQIPPELGNLEKLHTLILQNNNLSDSIPPEIGNLNNLIQLNLAFNNLDGTIPNEIGIINPLQFLFLNGNNLKGTIPSSFENLTNLIELELPNNNLTGEIPSFIGNFSQLRELQLGDNQFTGNIPKELGKLNLLTRLYLQNNQLSGCFPTELNTFCNLAFSNNVNIDGYNFTNNINLPNNGDFQAFCETGAAACEEEMTCKERDSLALVALWEATHENGPWTNEWDLELPLDTWYGVNLNQDGCVSCLDLDSEFDCAGSDAMERNLSGVLPVDISNLKELTFLRIAGNKKLSGNIPVEIGNLTNLTHLMLFDNNLIGELPIEIGNLTNLVNISLGKNNLSGNIPSSFGNLINLVQLFIWNNNLNGEIPIEIYNLISVVDIGLHNNNLEGEISKKIGNLINLESLDLRDNNISGIIPQELGNLKKLERFNLRSNNLSGEIPSSFGNLKSLNRLWLYDNQLTGQIPRELSELPNLERIYLHNNNLSGCIDNTLTSLCSLGFSEDTNENGYNFTNNPNLPNNGDFQAFCETNAGAAFQITFPENPINLEPCEEITLMPAIDALQTINEFQWQNTTHLSCADCPNPIATPTTSQTYTLIAGDGSGCTTEARITVNGQTPIDAPTFDQQQAPFQNSSNFSVNFDKDYALQLLESPDVEVTQGNELGEFNITTKNYFFGETAFTYEICDPLNPECCTIGQIDINVEAPIQFPKAFSPNGDGINDQFTILFDKYGFGGTTDIALKVFNEMGDVVYAIDNGVNYSNTQAWDGRHDRTEKMVPAGAYYYVCKIGDGQRTISGRVAVLY